jgi:hypothetical protein
MRDHVSSALLESFLSSGASIVCVRSRKFLLKSFLNCLRRYSPHLSRLPCPWQHARVNQVEDVFQRTSHNLGGLSNRKVFPLHFVALLTFFIAAPIVVVGVRELKMHSTLVRGKRPRLLSSDEKRRLTEYREDKLHDVRKYAERLFIDLANLHDDGSQFFWKRRKWIPPHQVPGDELFRLRDQLREVWRGDFHWLNEWLIHLNRVTPALILPDACVYSAGRARLRPRVIVVPNPLNIRAQLFFGVLEIGHKMAFCENPDCAAPYFFRYKDLRQRFCGEEQCRQYGQRSHKRNSWHKYAGSDKPKEKRRS